MIDIVTVKGSIVPLGIFFNLFKRIAYSRYVY